MLIQIQQSFGRWKYQRRKRPVCLLSIGGILWLFFLSVLLSGCTNPFFQPAHSGANQQPTQVAALTPTRPVSPTPTPVPPNITLQVVGCPSTLSINWDSLVGTKPHINKVQKVICGNLLGNGSLQAVVNTRYYSPDAKLDCYVFNLSGNPVQLFAVSGLLDGDAQISVSGTLMTAEIGRGDALKVSPDVFKEYRWNGSTFGQVLFPGIYPDMTDYQAEQDQAVVSSQGAQGLTSWKTSASAVVANMAVRVFHWNPQSISTKTITYSVTRGNYSFAVNNLGSGGGGFVANLFRLDNVATNIFEIMQVSSIDGNTLLTNPAGGAQLSSPVNATGSALASGSVIGHVVVYDDTFITVGDSGAIRSAINSGLVNFTTAINYHLNAPGLSEGVVVFLSTTQNNIALSNQAVVAKVFLVG